MISIGRRISSTSSSTVPVTCGKTGLQLQEVTYLKPDYSATWKHNQIMHEPNLTSQNKQAAPEMNDHKTKYNFKMLIKCH